MHSYYNIVSYNKNKKQIYIITIIGGNVLNKKYYLLSLCKEVKLGNNNVPDN